MMRGRLPCPAAHRICPRMRAIFAGFAILLLFTATGAQAQTRKPPAHAAPAASAKKLATFEDWTAAIHQESGQTVCYAFTRAMSSVPALPGRITLYQYALSKSEKQPGYRFPGYRY